jgi:hypothetical protein
MSAVLLLTSGILSTAFAADVFTAISSRQPEKIIDVGHSVGERFTELQSSGSTLKARELAFETLTSPEVALTTVFCYGRVRSSRVACRLNPTRAWFLRGRMNNFLSLRINSRIKR